MALHPCYASGSGIWSQFHSIHGDACISINNSQSEAFGLFRSIRQGFPLAPTLYVLAAEGFGYLLAHSVSSGLVRGISLPESSAQIVNGHFFDDSFLTLLEEEENIKNSLPCLDTFFLASGSSIQWHKTLCYRQSFPQVCPGSANLSGNGSLMVKSFNFLAFILPSRSRR